MRRGQTSDRPEKGIAPVEVGALAKRATGFPVMASAQEEAAIEGHRMAESITLVVNNDPSELNRVTKLLASLCAENAIPPDLEYDLNLALDEIVTNVITHAFGEGHAHQCTLRITLDKNEFVARVEDDGPEFNPVAHPAPDLDAPLAERKAGGLGIHLVRSIMDGFEYERAGGKNLVTLRKKIGGDFSTLEGTG